MFNRAFIKDGLQIFDKRRVSKYLETLDMLLDMKCLEMVGNTGLVSKNWGG